MIAAVTHRHAGQGTFQGVALTVCHLDDDRDIPVSAAAACLSPEERDRAARFRFDRDARRYIRGRGFLRRGLGASLGAAPSEVPLTEGAHGKPALACPGPGFNLSHSLGLAVLAVREAGPVGVDLELHSRSIDPLALAPTCFVSHEIDAIAALADQREQRDRFLTFWTAKEALMKLTGEGMGLDPKSIALHLESGFPVGYLAPDMHRSVVLSFPDLGPGRHVALAWRADAEDAPECSQSRGGSNG